MALWKKTFISPTEKMKNINSPQFQVIFFFNADRGYNQKGV